MVNRVIRKAFYITLILAGVLIPSGNAFAEDDTTFSITVNPSLNLSVSKAISGFSVTPSKNGTYDSDSFNVISSTNNATGYTLIMSVDGTDLVSETINVNTGDPLTIPTLTKTQDGISAEAFAASTDAGVLNHYGVSIAGANYNAMEVEKEIKKTTENNSTSDTTAISLAAKLNLLTVPAVYSRTINFEMTANALPEPTPPGVQGGSINEASSHQGMSMGDSSNISYPANSLLRSLELAYVQAGKPIYIEDSNADIGWRPMTSSDAGGQVRFAIQDISMTFTENDVTHKVCEWAAESTSNFVDEALVMDIRDGKSYWIAKLADGKCWMTQNLDLDLVHTANDADAKYTHANTDLGWGSDHTINSWNPENATTTASNGVFTGWVADYDNPYSVDPGDWYWNNTWYSGIDDCYDSGTGNFLCNYLDGNTAGKFSQSSSSFSNGIRGHVGNYYNWTAAIASNDSSSYTSSTYTDISGNPQNSICPAGWRLPTISNASDIAGSTNEFKRLTTLYGNNMTDDTDFIANPLNFVRGGCVGCNGYADGNLEGSGSDGFYWSSTVFDDAAYYLYFESRGIYPESNGFPMYDGFSVRCVAR